MIAHGKNIKVFSANANPKLAQDIASIIGVPVGKSAVTTFSDGEITVAIGETVRGRRFCCSVHVLSCQRPSYGTSYYD